MSSTEKQLAARRANALKSTGPRTDQGKAVSSLNALRHGLRSDRVLVPGELTGEYEAFARGFFEALDPADMLEASFAERIVHSAWRLRRVVNFEAVLLRRPIAAGKEPVPSSSFPASAAPSDSTGPKKDALPSLPLEPVPVADPPDSGELFPLSTFHHPAHVLASELERGCDTTQTLTRYETTLHRRLLSDLSTFESLRATRLANERARLQNELHRLAVEECDRAREQRAGMRSQNSGHPRHSDNETRLRGQHDDPSRGAMG
jgi:hypothetical protein